jgi:RimJ/RimL family protein N-acetyltransferase
MTTPLSAFPSRDRERFIAHWAKIMADAKGIQKTILFDGQVAGNIVSWMQDGEQEVGYWVGRAFWGKGIATSALEAFLSHVTVRPLYAHVVKHNAASLRVLEKCGFVKMAEADEEIILKLD